MSIASSINGLRPGVHLRRGEGQRDDAPVQDQPATSAVSSAGALDASGAKAPVNALAALLGSIGSAKGGEPLVAEANGTTAAAAVAAGPTSPAAPRPNLDALNRVLAHYAAQSAAASLPYGIVES